MPWRAFLHKNKTKPTKPLCKTRGLDRTANHKHAHRLVPRFKLILMIRSSIERVSYTALNKLYNMYMFFNSHG